MAAPRQPDRFDRRPNQPRSLMARVSFSRFVIAAFVIAVGVSATCHAEPRSERTIGQVDSPDRQLLAVLITLAATTNYGGEESRVEIRDRANRLLALKDFSSSDSNHGEIVDHSEWTPDSQFFVFNVVSSGGHQPWQSPVWFYSRKGHRIREVSELIDDRPVLYDEGPPFEIIPPHSIKITTWKKPGLEKENDLPLVLNLAAPAPRATNKR
jgi:hypothetical protein